MLWSGKQDDRVNDRIAFKITGITRTQIIVFGIEWEGTVFHETDQLKLNW